MTKAASVVLHAVLALLWGAAVCSGAALLYSHALTPGDAGAAPPEWPAESRLRPDPSRATLVMLAHPRCPCMGASLEDLARLLARSGDKVDAHVVFLQPEDGRPGWSRTDTMDAAEAIPGVVVSMDPGGAEAKLFGARTSGHVVLYSASGRLAFSGGITPLRAHAGDSSGGDALLARLVGGAAPVESDGAPVYGCSLFEDDREAATR